MIKEAGLVAEHVADTCEELRQESSDAGLNFLAHILALAVSESRNRQSVEVTSPESSASSNERVNMELQIKYRRLLMIMVDEKFQASALEKIAALEKELREIDE